MMEQKGSNEERNPKEQFKNDLRAMCQAVFGPDWVDRHPGEDAIRRLGSYDFLPGEFAAMYEIIGGEERLHRHGVLPVDGLELDQIKCGSGVENYLIFCRDREMEFAFSGDCQYGNTAFKGLYCCDRHDADRRAWREWCFWGAQSQFQTLAAALLRLIGEVLSRETANCVWVQVPVRKEGKMTRYETLAKRLDCVALQSVYCIGFEYLCDPERGLLVRYSDDGCKKVLVYGQSIAALEGLGGQWEIKWQRREGKRILDPATFIQSVSPVTFSEKLEELSQILLGKRSLALTVEQIEKAEARLGIRFPSALRAFYLRFGKGGKLMTAESMHTIMVPGDLEPKSSGSGEAGLEALRQENSLVLACENQCLWTMYLDLYTGEPWMDWGNGRQDCWGLDLEEVLLYLLAMNAVGFLPQAAECTIEDTPENRELLGRFFHFVVEGKMAVFVNPERGVICVRDREDHVYICARRESEMTRLETDIDLQLSWL